MKTNTKAPKTKIRTHEGTVAARINAYQQLRRSVMSCMLWEKEFYEDGTAIADRIAEFVPLVPAQNVADLAIEARSDFNLRHVPLFLVAQMTNQEPHKALVAETLQKVIQRADEPGEFLAMLGVGQGPRKVSLPAQVKKGLAKAFTKFDEYQLAKYDRDSIVKLRDVLFLTHAKPKDDAQAAVWKKLVDKTLAPPDTWEVSLSAGADKRATWERLLSDNKLGYLALLRNLRNMDQAGVDAKLVDDAILARKGADRVLPFRFVAAARACPKHEPALDKALVASLATHEPLRGTTVVLVDVSGSMDAGLSNKSDLKRIDAAATLASMVVGTHRTFTFSEHLVEVPPRMGMAGVDAIVRSQQHGGTYLGRAVSHLNANVPHDRLIVVTDEQSHDTVPAPTAKHAYMINVASARNGVGYGRWTHLDGFSESVLRFIREIEKED